MKRLRLLEKARKSYSNGNLVDPSCGLYAEEYFHEVLRLERMRTERSGSPFLLMLMHIDKLGQADKGGIVGRIASTLITSTRETDIKGWYRLGSTIGVIFTEPNGTDVRILKGKIMDCLYRDISDSRLLDRIRITFHVYPEEAGAGKSNGPLDGELYPDLARKRPSKSVSHFLKRTIDLTGGIAGLVIFAPFFVFTPILIKLTSKGPVFFRQERVGHLGRKFSFLKFRTMHIHNDHSVHKKYIEKFISGDVEKDGVYKIKDDPRVTPLGRVLRKTSLDELPQFINVIKGEMSLVGPRPPIPYELEKYDVWHRRRILETKPGITGLWQVRGRSSTNFDEMVRLDLKYVREWSLWLDVKILLRTPWAVINCRGAY